MLGAVRRNSTLGSSTRPGATGQPVVRVGAAVWRDLAAKLVQAWVQVVAGPEDPSEWAGA